MDTVVYEFRVALWVLSMASISFGTYLAWPSRWNIPAHMSVGFFGVSQVVPVVILGALDDEQDTSSVVLLTKILCLGAVCYLAGVLIGGGVGRRPASVYRWGEIVSQVQSREVSSRVAVVAILGIVMLSSALLVMGFVPLAASDPFAAKFFRGAYGDSYMRVAWLYRGGVALTALVFPLVVAYALKSRRAAWFILGAVALGMMVITLQRSPAFTGLLLVVGALLVSRGRLGLFFTCVVVGYSAGALFYPLLSFFGFQGMSPNDSSGSVLSLMAKSAPDVPDVISFIHRWVLSGEPQTFGRTFIGGLVPGRFPWNPGVWTLTLGDQSINVDEISSGGLRLPMPVWGYVSFGVLGVVCVAFASGVAAGRIAVVMKYLVGVHRDVAINACVLVVGGVATSLLSGFYVLGYMDVAQALVLYWALRPAFREVKRPRFDAAPV